jgi:CHAT domain-containing protein/tetratricopeptide (TPR) repeat protein
MAVDEAAAGLAAFGHGIELYNVSQMAAARARFGEAERALRHARNPFHRWAAFYGAVCEHYSDPVRAAQTFATLRRDTDATRYPTLVGRSEWLLGTVANNRGRPEEALRHYRAALRLIDRSAGPQLAAFVHVLLAEAHTALGENELAWEERVTALAGVQQVGEPRRIHAALMEAATALLDHGDAAPALAVTDELVENARRWGKPSALAEASLKRGTALGMLGRHPEALVELRAAARHAARLAPSLRARIDGPVALATAQSLSEQDPGMGVEVLSAAIAADQRNGFLFLLPRLFAARARAHSLLVDDAGAEDDLQRAIGYHEDVRGSVHDPRLRMSTFGWAQPAFDQMIAAQVDAGRPARAFEFAEQSRSRVLLELVAGGGGGRPPAMTRPPSAGELLPRLPPHLRLVEYAVLPDRLLAWVAGRGSLELVTVAVSQPRLEQLVDRLRNSLERQASADEIRAASDALHAVLVRPLEAWLPPDAPLVLVPDRVLTRVPFAALFDGRRGRYLLQDRVLTIAPSATLFLEEVERSRTPPAGELSALVVGDPAFDRQRHPWLPRLAEARAEAAEVAALHPGSVLLQSEQATRAAVLAHAGEHRLLHFAGHAMIHPEAHLSHLLLADDGGADAGALYADELARQRFARTEVVVLSACRTVAGGGVHRENLTGLAAAFLAAGPTVVVASLWDVEDRPTRELMRHFHVALRSNDAASALRGAQLALLVSQDPVLRSPAAWAGFQVIGGVTPAP